MGTLNRKLLLLWTILAFANIFGGAHSKPSESQGVKLKVKVRISPGPATISQRSSSSAYQNNYGDTATTNVWGSTGSSFSGGPSSSEKLYILRRKKGHKNKSQGTVASAPSYNNVAQGHSHSLPDPGNNPDWVTSLQEAYSSSLHTGSHYSAPFKTKKPPVMVETPPTSHNFRANIPLPKNPFMPSSLQPQPHPQTGHGQNFAQDFSNDKYFQKSYPQDNPPSYHSPSPPNSRADTFLSSLTSLTQYMNKALPNLPSTLGKWAKTALASTSSSHYTKPGSGSSPPTPPPSIHILDSAQAASKPTPVISAASAAAAASASRAASFDSLLSQLHRVEEIKASLPPRGSYTPYGERTIIMIKFPGLPPRKRIFSSPSSLGSLSLGANIFSKPVSIVVDDWGTPSSRPIRLKDSDVGVIISQNYILQPDVSMNSHYNFDRVPDPVGSGSGVEDDSSSNPSTDMVTLLAKALAERNRLINTYARKAANGGMSSAPPPEPPFVLVHLETFTKKRNNTTPFGFVEEIESSYANGTIIYPTLDDPGVLASTRFEFEGESDVEGIFDRPLQGVKVGVGLGGGGMRPIVPLGLVEIQNYLRLMYQIHRDIHEGGRAKVGGLARLSHTVERTPLPGSRGMDEWEVRQRMEKYKENWLHTSTIGLRSISDYPPPPPKLPIPYPT